MRTPRAIIISAVFGLSAAACVDSPSAPASAADENVLAASLDAMSREAAQDGDSERSQEFSWAALAVRDGVTPSRLQLRVGGTSETYEAIVHAVSWVPTMPAKRAPSHRTLLAWRRAGSALQTLMISATADVSPVQNPLSFSVASVLAAPFAGAHVLYVIRGGATPGWWVGVSGNVKLAEGALGTPCSPSTAGGTSLPGITCQQLTYTVGFEVTLRPTEGKSLQPSTRGSPLVIGAQDQTINGAKLVLSCANPTSRGC